MQAKDQPSKFKEVCERNHPIIHRNEEDDFIGKTDILDLKGYKPGEVQLIAAKGRQVELRFGASIRYMEKSEVELLHALLEEVLEGRLTGSIKVDLS